MSDGEFITLIVHAVIGSVIWGRYMVALVHNSPLDEFRPLRALLFCTPIFLAVSLLLLLQFYAASDVRSSLYLFFYLVMGAAWVGLAIRAVSLLGVDFRDDVDERQNPAATVFYLGVMIGFTLAFTGSNFGEGPSWMVVAFCSSLSMGSLLFLWILVAKLTGALDAVTIDRDTPTGMRLACLLIACGAILGRAVAGDWEGTVGALLDFTAFLLPLAVLAAAEIVVGYLVKPRPGAEALYPAPVLRGVLPGLAYVGFAAWFLVVTGWW
ncbi:MAG: hypothetical protein ACF8MJ_05240 [Phycisphaerales bacterium JB050]